MAHDDWQEMIGRTGAFLVGLPHPDPDPDPDPGTAASPSAPAPLLGSGHFVLAAA